jgi:hypothetical protein
VKLDRFHRFADALHDELILFDYSVAGAADFVIALAAPDAWDAVVR